jgi:hypothetical protein
MDLPIAIPSYQRPELCKNLTLTFLKLNQYPTDLITVFVASEEEKLAYEKNIARSLYGKIVVGKKGLKEQRNFITEYYDEDQVYIGMDDDVKGIKSRFLTFPQLVLHAKNLFEKHTVGLFGVMPNDDTRRFKDDYTTHLAFILGSFFICRNHKDLLITVEEKQDYEKTLQYFLRYGSVIRYRGAGVSTDYTKNAGGLQQEGREQRMLEGATYLGEKYPAYCRVMRKNNKPDIFLDFRATPPPIPTVPKFEKLSGNPYGPLQ